MNKFFLCDILDCKAQFKTKYSLKRHMKLHKVKKQFKCPSCPKEFSLQQYLVEHSYTHTREKPFVCGIDGCQEKFRQRGKRSIHQKEAHGKVSHVGLKRPGEFCNRLDSDEEFAIPGRLGASYGRHFNSPTLNGTFSQDRWPDRTSKDLNFDLS